MSSSRKLGVKGKRWNLAYALSYPGAGQRLRLWLFCCSPNRLRVRARVFGRVWFDEWVLVTCIRYVSVGRINGRVNLFSYGSH